MLQAGGGATEESANAAKHLRMLGNGRGATCRNSSDVRVVQGQPLEPQGIAAEQVRCAQTTAGELAPSRCRVGRRTGAPARDRARRILAAPAARVGSGPLMAYSPGRKDSRTSSCQYRDAGSMMASLKSYAGLWTMQAPRAPVPAPFPTNR